MQGKKVTPENERTLLYPDANNRVELLKLMKSNVYSSRVNQSSILAIKILINLFQQLPNVALPPIAPPRLAVGVNRPRISFRERSDY